jgi:hypothetical protein
MTVHHDPVRRQVRRPAAAPDAHKSDRPPTIKLHVPESVSTPADPPDNPARGWSVHLAPDALQQAAGLSGNALRVLIALHGYCRTGDYCWPSNAKLAESAGLGVQQTGRGLAELEEAGWIRRDGSPHGGRRDGITLLRRIDRCTQPPIKTDRCTHQDREVAPIKTEESHKKETQGSRPKNDDTRPVVVESPPSTREDPELAPLVARATERFGANYQRVEQAVEAYGKEWVEQALERPGTERWGGVLHTLNEYTTEGGPLRKPVKAPVATVNQWQMPGETPEETAERHRKALLALAQPAAAIATTPVEGGEFTAMWKATRRAPCP